MHADRMDSLTALAFNSYIENGIVGAARLSVPPHVIAERFHALRQLAPAHEKQVRNLYLWWAYEHLGLNPKWLDPDWPGLEWLDPEWLGHEWYVEDKRHPEGNYEVRATEEDTSPAQVDVKAEAETSSAPEPPTPDRLELCSQPGHGLRSSWEFHKGDADPYPAVPHGHGRQGKRTQNWPKLDPYRGFVYDKSGAQVDREPRRAIVALWNDPKFRNFAREALLHALERDSTLERRIKDERGITNPLLLPGERGRRGR